MVNERKQLGGQALRFALVGVIATLLHYGIYYFLQRVINVNIAYTIGYVLSFLVNFYLTDYFTFHSAPSWKKLTGMGGAHAVNYLLHLVLLNLFLWLGVREEWAPFPVPLRCRLISCWYVGCLRKRKKKICYETGNCSTLL